MEGGEKREDSEISVSRRDIFTQYGESLSREPWRVGPPVIDEDYIPRAEEPQALRLLIENHIVYIQGEPRLGKSSLARKLAGELVKAGQVSKVKIDLSSWYGPDRWDETKSGSLPVAIIPNEVEWESKDFDKYLAYLAQVRQAGNYVILEGVGDVNTNQSPEKDAIKALVGESIITLTSATREQILQVIRGGGQPIFTPKVEEWLLRQSGGHLMWTQLLASTTYDELSGALKQKAGHNEKKGWSKYNPFKKKGQGLMSWNKAWQIVEKALENGNNIGGFGYVVDRLIKDGINPLTWEGENTNNSRVFDKSILPQGSELFNKLLKNYIDKRSMNKT